MHIDFYTKHIIIQCTCSTNQYSQYFMLKSHEKIMIMIHIQISNIHGYNIKSANQNNL